MTSPYFLLSPLSTAPGCRHLEKKKQGKRQLSALCPFEMRNLHSRGGVTYSRFHTRCHLAPDSLFPPPHHFCHCCLSPMEGEGVVLSVEKLPKTAICSLWNTRLNQDSVSPPCLGPAGEGAAMGLNPAKLVQPSVGWAPYWKESPSANNLTPAVYPGRVRNIGRLGVPLGGMGGPVLVPRPCVTPAGAGGGAAAAAGAGGGCQESPHCQLLPPSTARGLQLAAGTWQGAGYWKEVEDPGLGAVCPMAGVFCP